VLSLSCAETSGTAWVNTGIDEPPSSSPSSSFISLKIQTKHTTQGYNNALTAALYRNKEQLKTNAIAYYESGKNG